MSSTSGIPGQNAKTSMGNSNVFEAVLNDANAVQDKLLGPTYPYYQNVNSPGEMGMSSHGSLTTLGRDINGLVNYIQLLVEGSGGASKTGRPLGNKFFLKTGAKCIDVNTNAEVDRYIYVNNVPTGNIPFISQGMGVNFKEFRGLIPGMMTNVNALNPYTIMQSFLAGSMPQCQKIQMQVIDNNNRVSNESNYVTLVDIQNMDPCNFQNGVNPVSNKKCQQAMTNRTDEKVPLPSDPIVQFYFLGLSCLGIYLLYRYTKM